MPSSVASIKETQWPELRLANWKDTCDTLHMWTQIVGKVRLALCPPMNHWWETVLYITARGMTTSPIPYKTGVFEVSFDFIDHHLRIETSWCESRTLKLYSRSVADFYHEFMDTLQSLEIDVKIWPMPQEFENPIRFDQDKTHASYDPEYANRFWRTLVTIDTIFKEYRGQFIGKASPVHFFWGSFDLAVTRFSGRKAPENPQADPVTKEAYSHEEASAGFWPGSGVIQDAAFYAYTFPEPDGYQKYSIKPKASFYDTTFKEYILMYEDVRNSDSPRQTLIDFLQSTYEAGANLGKWDRDLLERKEK